MIMNNEELLYLRRLELENKRLREALKDAIIEVESWGAYASEYFQKKWDLEGTIKDLKSNLDD